MSSIFFDASNHEEYFAYPGRSAKKVTAIGGKVTPSANIKISLNNMRSLKKNIVSLALY